MSKKRSPLPNQFRIRDVNADKNGGNVGFSAPHATPSQRLFRRPSSSGLSSGLRRVFAFLEQVAIRGWGHA